MRSLVIAASAAAMAVPVSMALPMEEAQAQSRYYRNGTYVGRPGVVATAASIAAVPTARRG